MSKSKNVLMMKEMIENFRKENLEKTTALEQLQTDNEVSSKKINKLKKDKLLLESLLKKKTYEIEELERNYFVKVEGLKDMYEKRIVILETTNQEEIKELINEHKK
jgi:hypothetical protein